MIEVYNDYIFEKSYEYGELINQTYESPLFIQREVLSRVYVLAIYFQPPFKYAFSISHIWLLISEMVRHLVGTVTGSLVGVVSPKTARNHFLPPDQSIKAECSDNLTPVEAGRLYGMCQVVHVLFDRAGIDYCATGGTQLGVHREGGIISWDDDVDFAVKVEDRERIEALREDLVQHGIELLEIPEFGFKFFDKNGTDLTPDSNLGETIQVKFPFIDICLFRREGNKYVYEYDRFRTYYSGEYFTRVEWDNKELQQFGLIQVKAVAAPDAPAWVVRAYGESAMKYGYQPFSHKGVRVVFTRKLQLKKEEDGKCKPIDFDREAFDTSFPYAGKRQRIRSVV